jgi:hypothetical protein
MIKEKKDYTDILRSMIAELEREIENAEDNGVNIHSVLDRDFVWRMEIDDLMMLITRKME